MSQLTNNILTEEKKVSRPTEIVYSLEHYYVSFPMKLALMSAGFLTMIFLKVISIFSSIRIGILTYERLGELCINTELYFRRLVDNDILRKEKHILITGIPANRQLVRMIQRKVTVVEVNKYCLWMMKKLYALFPNASFWIHFDNFDNIYHEFSTKSAQLSFVSEEERQGIQLLEKMGIGPKDPFVCLHVRDKSFLDKIHPFYDRKRWSYHDYRDCDIDTYMGCAEYLASCGIYTIRMGYIVEKEFNTDSPFVIDYASKYRCDFGDIYLSAHCKFFVGTEGGLITVPWIFNVPVAFSNRIPVTVVAGMNRSNIILPKKLWSRSKKRYLTFREVYAIGADQFFFSSQYEQAGLDIVDNSPEEIVGLVKEMNSRLDGTWITTQEDEELQERYRQCWPKGAKYYVPQELKNWDALPRISAEFLRQNKDLLT